MPATIRPIMEGVLVLRGTMGISSTRSKTTMKIMTGSVSGSVNECMFNPPLRIVRYL